MGQVELFIGIAKPESPFIGKFVPVACIGDIIIDIILAIEPIMLNIDEKMELALAETGCNNRGRHSRVTRKKIACRD